jgi:hypothetical protein
MLARQEGRCRPVVVLSVSPRDGRHWRVGVDIQSRAMIASAYIRQLRSGLPLCCMHG